MYGYAFRRALRYRAETWHRGRGRAHEDLRAYIRSDTTEGQRSFRGQVALEMSHGHQIWCEEALTEV